MKLHASYVESILQYLLSVHTKIEPIPEFFSHQYEINTIMNQGID